MAEALARAAWGEAVAVESAGWRPSQDGATSEAVAVMRQAGLDLSAHRTRRVGELDLDGYDLVVALTSSLGARLEGMMDRARLLVWEIEDPYGEGIEAYRACARCLEARLRDPELASRLGLTAT